MRSSPSRALHYVRRMANVWIFGWCSIRYLLAGSRRGVQGVIDLVLGNHSFRAGQVAEELRGLGEIVASRPPQRALEIGTADGGTLLFLTRLAAPRATIVSVDLPEGYDGLRAWFYKRFARRNQQLLLVRGDSHNSKTLDRVNDALMGQQVDYLFIDGDHSYEGVKRDFEMYTPVVRKGGLIAFHDIVDGVPELVGGVPRFWREIKSQFRHIELIKEPHQGGYGIGVLYVD
ncbi:MAG: class I SAM-dependent methyltransferase [Terriglobia bacterium]